MDYRLVHFDSQSLILVFPAFALDSILSASCRPIDDYLIEPIQP